MLSTIRYVASTATLLLTLAACTTDDPAPIATPEPATSPTQDPSPSESAPTTTPTPAGGTADAPEVVEPRTELLDWESIPGSVNDTVTRGGGWTLTVAEGGTQAELAGPDSASGSGSTSGRVSDAFLDNDYAVIVFQDKQEQDPNRAEITDLATGESFAVDGDSDIPTTNGGTWALGEGHLLHATVTDEGDYCLVSVDLATMTSTLGWCAPKRHGFNGARISPAGDAVMTFDDSQPSCRTVAAVAGSQIEPFPGVSDCKGWEGVLTDGGAVWSVVPKDNRIESAHFYARSGDGYFDLGAGTSGTLTWCSGSAYFVRDPQLEGDPARLMRWNAGDSLTVAYESPAGEAFLAAPRCGGDTMNVTALAESGDEQVSAALG